MFVKQYSYFGQQHIKPKSPIECVISNRCIQKYVSFNICDNEAILCVPVSGFEPIRVTTDSANWNIGFLRYAH